MLISRLLRAKRKIVGTVMSELLLDLLHALDLVGTSVGTRANRLVVLDSKVDSRYRVFARKHTDLMSSLILESRRGGIKHDHLVVLLDDSLHLFFELVFVFDHELALHDVVLCIGSHFLHIVTIWLVDLLAAL